MGTRVSSHKQSNWVFHKFQLILKPILVDLKGPNRLYQVNLGDGENQAVQIFVSTFHKSFV